MAPSRIIRNAVLASLAVAIPVACIPIYYAYPTVAHIPAVTLEGAPDGVRAFRVDVVDQEGSGDFPHDDRYVLTQVRRSRTGNVPGQTTVALDHGWVWNCIALSYDGHTHHTVLVRLYCPGWQTAEIKAGEKTRQVTWKEATSTAAKEQAIDALLSTWQTDSQAQLQARLHSPIVPDSREVLPIFDSKMFRNLAPGSAAPEHRQVLVFAAAEYDRLAEVLGAGDMGNTQRARLADKATWLRQLSEK